MLGDAGGRASDYSTVVDEIPRAGCDSPVILLTCSPAASTTSMPSVPCCSSGRRQAGSAFVAAHSWRHLRRRAAQFIARSRPSPDRGWQAQSFRESRPFAPSACTLPHEFRTSVACTVERLMVICQREQLLRCWKPSAARSARLVSSPAVSRRSRTDDSAASSSTRLEK